MVRNFLLFLVVVILCTSCKTEFSVNGEYEEMPVVHFILDHSESYHFLKLNKTFLKDGNAYEFAKDPSLSYFDNVVATVTEVGGLNRTWTLKDTLITNKEEGTFYYPNQKLYFFVANDLDENATYKLHINIDNGTYIVEGQTQLIKDVNITYPQQKFSFNFAENDVSQNGYRSTPITFTLGNGAIYKVQVRFDYDEHTASGHTVKSLIWNLGSKERSNISTSKATIPAYGESFYEFLQNKINIDSDVIKRNVNGMEIILTIGSEELLTYMMTNEPSSSIAQSKPTFSNVDGGLGIFTSRYTIKQYKAEYKPLYHTRALNYNSTQELCNGQYTFKLKFCSSIAPDNSSSFTCN